MKRSPIPYVPTLQQLQQAHSKFLDDEARDIFYRAATELIGHAWRGESSLSVAEAVAVLLQTWNQSYYRFHQEFDARHFAAIENLNLIHAHIGQLNVYRARSVESFAGEDDIESLIEAFETVRGPVGAAKALHLLAPRFFPLWDRDIAAGYRIHLRPKGEYGGRYVTFMLYAQTQSALLEGEYAIGRNPLKAIDEYNYSKITQGWM